MVLALCDTVLRKVASCACPALDAFRRQASGLVGDQVKLQIWFSVTDHSLAALQHESGFVRQPFTLERYQAIFAS
ncbi:hypothetical protein B6S44_12910 [Bosea sp. Tri-44]|nr:hypothetical protein B6S44_12910 [Bosea sp. Tri-44]